MLVSYLLVCYHGGGQELALLPPQPHRVFAGLVGLFFYPVERCPWVLGVLYLETGAPFKRAPGSGRYLIYLRYLTVFEVKPGFP
jgi:hypothetical protein